ncbi:alpha-1A adrenergic receptor-like [Lytechinus pictus]|uniref:alpha-1A adrenergic receptor-like n=1 Tax=Lytechinus pictus TaxID=7653 RepID=UPI0030BA1F45
MAPVSVLGNGFTFSVLSRETSGFDDVTKQILKSFTIANIVLGIGEALVSQAQLHLSTDAKRDIVCLYHGPFLYLCFFFILSLTCLLNVIRYITVTRPLRYHLIVTDHRVSVAIGIAIVESLLLTTIIAPFPGTPAEQFHRHLCSQDEEKVKGSYYLMFLIAYVILVAGITITSTVRLLCISRRQSKAIAGFQEHTFKGASSSSGETHVTHQSLQTVNTSAANSKSDGSDRVAAITKRQHSRNRRAFLTIFILNIVVIVSWIPLTIFYSLAFSGVKVSPILKCVMMISIMSTTCWHWLVYITTNKLFRETALAILQKFWARLSQR